MRQTSNFYDIFDAFFNDNFNGFVPQATRRVAQPQMNVLEDEDSYKVQIAAPGMTKEDMVVKLDDEQNLVISIEKKEEKQETSGETVETKEAETKDVAVAENEPAPRYHRHEIFHQSFVQKLRLPDDVKLEGISAKMENGLLEVVIPKMKEEDKARLERHISID